MVIAAKHNNTLSQKQVFKEKMKKMKNWISLLLLLGVFACAEDATSNKQNENLYVDYYIRYLQAEKQLKAEAKFSAGKTYETALPTELDGNVLFQERTLNPIRVQSKTLRYQREFKRKYENKVSFSIKKDNNTEINHEIKFEPINDFSLNNGVINTQKDNTITWQGAKLKKGERLLALITDSKNKASSFEVKGPSMETAINIPAQKLQALAKGKGFVYLVKKQQNLEEKANASIHSQVEFYTDKIEILVE